MTHPLLKRLEGSRAVLLAVIADLPDSALDRRATEGWSIREMLTHLVNAEEDHRRVIAVVAAGEAHRLPATLDMNAHNEQRVAARGHLTKEELLAALADQRRQTETLLLQLRADQMEWIAPHPVLGDKTLDEVFRIIGMHERLHARDIAALLGDHDAH
jgi:uncharacterized damage-inducible protein DinB